ncbi:MAG: phage holin family protein [Terriglobales bacterium]
MGEQSRALRRCFILAAAGALGLFFSLLLLSLALVGLVAYAIASWRWGLLIVGGAYLLTGAALLLPLARLLRRGPMRFEHTRRRLRQDAAWVKRKFAA